jgi:hypothetical protein
MMQRFLFFSLALLVSGSIFADGHEIKRVAGLDLSQSNSLQMQLCSLKPGKKMKDYEASFDAYIAWSKKQGVETFALRLLPMYVTQPNNQPGYDWIELLAAPFEVSGEGWDKWLTTKEGQALNANWQSIADCRVSLNPIHTLYVDNTITAKDTRIVTMDWCSRLPGVSYDHIQEKHDSMLANRAPNSPVSAWSIVYKGLGMRNAPGEYMHMLSFANNAGLNAYMNNYANNEGWRQREAYQTSYASCSGQNVYFAEVLNRPGS